MLCSVYAFLDDTLFDAMKSDFVQSIRLFSPMAFCVGSYFAISTLPSYAEHRGICILFVNYVIANVTFNFMMNVMADKKYSVAQPTLLTLLVPYVAYHGFGVTAETEKMLTFGLTILNLVLFIAKMLIVCKQWVDFSGVPFFTTTATEGAKKTN